MRQIFNLPCSLWNSRRSFSQPDVSFSDDRQTRESWASAFEVGLGYSWWIIWTSSQKRSEWFFQESDRVGASGSRVNGLSFEQVRRAASIAIFSAKICKWKPFYRFWNSIMNRNGTHHNKHTLIIKLSRKCGTGPF